MEKAVNLQIVWFSIQKEIEGWVNSRFITRETFGILEQHHRGLMNDLPNRDSHRVAMSAIAMAIFTERKIVQGASTRLINLLEQFKIPQKPPTDNGDEPLE